MRALQKLGGDFDFVGRGGPHMKALAGEPFTDWIDQAAVVGLWEVIKRYSYFRRQFRETLSEIEEIKPDAVVLIDYPGFNLRLARALRRNIDLRSVRPAGLQPAEPDSPEKISAAQTEQSPMFRPKIIYYISPQVWAWNRGRIKKMARWLDLLLCIFPFEAELYNQSGLRTVFVGHPMIEKLRTEKARIKRDPNLIGLFPGSRPREVMKNFPIMLDAACELFRAKQVLRFEVAAASEPLATEISNILWEARMREGLFRVVTGETAATMQRAFAGIIASGSATLEAAYFRLPFVLVYNVSWLTYLAARLLVQVEFLGMPNVLANRKVVPEFIQHRAKPDAIAKAVLRLMYNAAARDQMISEFDEIIRTLGDGGASMQSRARRSSTGAASDKAARAILEELS